MPDWIWVAVGVILFVTWSALEYCFFEPFDRKQRA